LDGEHHARQNQNRRGNVSDWTASHWRTVIARSAWLVIDRTGGLLQVRQPGGNTSAQQFCKTVRGSTNDGIANRTGA
jgi:hypothetical protein